MPRHRSPKPGPTGAGWAGDFLSTVGGTLSGWSSAAGTWIGDRAEDAVGYGKSGLLTILELIPLKESSPVSTALLKHYVERSGGTYTLDAIPVEWQDWIVKATHGRPGMHRELNPYNSGLFDLRNSLGHFDVHVARDDSGAMIYTISDTYQFGAIKNDRSQRGRHGFPLGNLSPGQLAVARSVLPTGSYKNPGGFTERWEIKTTGKETILLIPQQYLAEQGTPFKVTGSFVR